MVIIGQTFPFQLKFITGTFKMSVNVHGMISLFPTNCLNNIHRKKCQVSTSVVYFWKLVINFSNSLIEHSVM